MPTWMVVEDEPDIYDVLLAMFEIWGIEGVAFVDGSEAIAWIEDVDAGRVRGDLPELAMLDIRLPEVSGPEISARLRQSPILGNSAIVLITAYHMPPSEEAEVLKTSEADLLLYKPLPSMPELRKAMNTIIDKRKRFRAATLPTSEDFDPASPEIAPDSDAADQEDEIPASPPAKRATSDAQPSQTTPPEEEETPPKSSTGKKRRSNKAD